MVENFLGPLKNILAYAVSGQNADVVYCGGLHQILTSQPPVQCRQFGYECWRYFRVLIYLKDAAEK